MKKVKTVGLIVGLSVSLFAGRADMYMEECNNGEAEMCQMAAQFLASEHKTAEANRYYKKVVKLTRKACDGGDWSACDNMGTFYTKGLVVKKSKAEAKKAYEKTLKILNKNCKKGDQDSCGAIEYINKKMKKLLSV